MPDQDLQYLVLREELEQCWRDVDVFAEVQRLDGPVARAVPGRETRRFELDGKAYYRKLHTGVGWAEIFKNLIRGRLPVIGARNEWLALNRLAEFGIPSLVPLAFGEKHRPGFLRNPATQVSFIVTRELVGTMELDKYLSAHGRSLSLKAKRLLVSEVAQIARAIHQQGINHRDLYLCHFLLDLESANAWRAGEAKPRLYLVDLHRAQLRNKVPRRWLVKDLASIYFSAMDFRFTRGDLACFLTTYFAQSLAMVMLEQASLLDQIEKRAQKLYRREQRLKARGLRD